MSEDKSNFKIFISHASENKNLAKVLGGVIKEAVEGAEPFFCFHLPPSTLWYDTIWEKLIKSDMLLVVTTPQSVVKLWVGMEIGGVEALNKAGYKKKAILICCFGGITPNNLPNAISALGRQVIVPTKSAEALDSLLKTIRDESGTRYSPDTEGELLKRLRDAEGGWKIGPPPPPEWKIIEPHNGDLLPSPYFEASVTIGSVSPYRYYYLLTEVEGKLWAKAQVITGNVVCPRHIIEYALTFRLVLYEVNEDGNDAIQKWYRVGMQDGLPPSTVGKELDGISLTNSY